MPAATSSTRIPGPMPHASTSRGPSGRRNVSTIPTEGYFTQKITRSGTRLWQRSTPDDNRRVAMNPSFGGGYVFAVGEGDRIEFRDTNGNLLRTFSRPFDDTVAD